METIELREWQKPLAEHQTKVLRAGRVMLSACHTGSGKTYLACQTIKDLGMPAIVVCPKIAISQWMSVVSGMGAKDVIAVVNPEKLVASKNNPFYSNEEGWLTDGLTEGKPALLVVDEIHRGCSGPDSKQTLMVARWCNRFHPGNKVLAMSATPFETPEKMRLIGYLMGFHRFVSSSWYDFLRANGCRYVDIGWGRNKRRILEFTRKREEAMGIMASLRDRMGERFMSIGPGEIPGFPDEVKEVELIDLAKKDHDALVKAYEEMPPQFQHMSEDDMVKTLRLREQAEWCKAQSLAEMAKELVEDGNSVFIAINFRATLDRVRENLDRLGIRYASIYGGQKDAERQAGIDEFQNNRTYVMIGMMQACSVALSLHDMKHERTRVSLISPSYAASDLLQALGRIRRVGGTTAVQKIILAAGSVEERVAKSVSRKIDCLETLTNRDLVR